MGETWLDMVGDMAAFVGGHGCICGGDMAAYGGDMAAFVGGTWLHLGTHLKKSIGIRYRRLLEKRYRYLYSVLKKWYRDNPNLDHSCRGFSDITTSFTLYIIRKVWGFSSQPLNVSRYANFNQNKAYVTYFIISDAAIENKAKSLQYVYLSKAVF